MLIFSTHDADFLDRLERIDDIYITRCDGSGISVSPVSFELDQKGLKVSEVIRSDYLTGTAPSYEALMKLKKKYLSMIGEGL